MHSKAVAALTLEYEEKQGESPVTCMLLDINRSQEKLQLGHIESSFKNVSNEATASPKTVTYCSTAQEQSLSSLSF